MRRLEGKTVFITGAGRGQGRSHAVRMAQEGAAVVATDICADIPTLTYSLSQKEDLEETARLVQAAGGEVLTAVADVRDQEQVDAAMAQAVERFGGVDVVLANAGILDFARAHLISESAWRDIIDVCLTGVWHTFKSAIPRMIERGAGGCLIATSSGAGLVGTPNLAHYVSAKHGLQGLMKTLANELGEHNIRVNTVNPTNVNTDMIMNDMTFRLFRPDLENPGADDIVDAAKSAQLLPIPWVETIDVSNAMVFLASDEARYITGLALTVDAGVTLKV